MTDRVERFRDPGYMRLLWFSLLAGPVIWAVYFLTGYLLNEVACQAGWFPFTILGMSSLSFITVIYTLVALGAVVYFGYWAYRQWKGPVDRRREHLESEIGGSEEDLAAADEEIEVWDRTRFMTFAGMLLSLLFGLTILLTGIPSLVLRSCG